jgi:shikimate kinase / 3-dehydroquinate synthase
MNRAIVITGFMGTGKSTVGQLLAQRLGCAFVDLDEVVESLAGRSIPALFDEGEECFRWWEQHALGQLDLNEPVVVATGGGTLVGHWNQARIAGAPVIVLDASLDTVHERIGETGARPLLHRLSHLYQRRVAAYSRLPLHVLTDGLSPEEVVERGLEVIDEMSARAPDAGGGAVIPVQTPVSQYDVHIATGVMAGIGGFTCRLRPGAVALVTDSVVAPLWAESVRHDLLAAGLRTTLIEIPAGESQKTLRTAELVFDQLLDASIDRSGVVVALGGGVVGDLAGFVAATWMRGVRGFIQVPTTLLSMVDASVGGKTGVDHPRGKNLIGAFRHPDLVLIDPSFLQTLPLTEVQSGLAEVVKHSVIADSELFEALGSWNLTSGAHPSLGEWERILARSVQVKIDIVERDPYERGERAKLNLGHTFGHAYELMSGFKLSHGQAVSIGMVTAARLSEKIGLAERGLAAHLESTLSGLGLPVRWTGARTGADVWRVMQSDKKKAAGRLRFVLPRAVGDVIVTEPGEIDQSMVLSVIEKQNAEV